MQTYKSLVDSSATNFESQYEKIKQKYLAQESASPKFTTQPCVKSPDRTILKSEASLVAESLVESQKAPSRTSTEFERESVQADDHQVAYSNDLNREQPEVAKSNETSLSSIYRLLNDTQPNSQQIDEDVSAAKEEPKRDTVTVPVIKLVQPESQKPKLKISTKLQSSAGKIKTPQKEQSNLGIVDSDYMTDLRQIQETMRAIQNLDTEEEEWRKS